MDLENVSFKRVPVWIRLPRLHLSLWNPVSIGKIASYVGKPIGTDGPTANRERMDFARVLVEVELMDELPEVIPVEREELETIYQDVEFEWRPLKCSRCGKLGHGNALCKAAPRMVWVEKAHAPPVERELEGSIVDAPVEALPSPVKSLTPPNQQAKKQEQEKQKSVQQQKATKNKSQQIKKQQQPPKSVEAKKTGGDRGKGLSEQSMQQGKTITLQSPGVVVVQMAENHKDGSEFDNQRMQIAGGGKVRTKSK